MVTVDDVRMAYRLILGREPESEQVVREAAAAYPSFGEMRRAFLKSVEFRGKLDELGAGPTRRSGLEPPMDVETAVDAATLARLLDRVRRSWTRLAESEPHWAVLTSQDFTRSNIDGHRDVFYASGRHDVDRLAAFLARGGVALPPDARCLEMGCGVGRVTGWLAGRFAEVTAVDVAPPMLRLAEEHLRARDAANTRLVLLDSVERLGTLGGFDLVFSALVIQHNPPPVMAHLLERLLGVLVPGGVAFLQFPTSAPDYRFRATEYLSRDPDSHSMEMHALPQPVVFGLIERAGCRVLEMAEDELVGNRLWRSNTMLVRKAGGA